MAEYHTFIVHFPIALYITAAGIEFIRLWKKNIPPFFSISLIWVGAVIGIIAAYSGEVASQSAKTIPGIKPVLDDHAVFGTFTAWFGMGSAFILLVNYLKYGEKLILKWIILLILVVGATYTGYLGGQLVREFGAGVNFIGIK